VVGKGHLIAMQRTVHGAGGDFVKEVGQRCEQLIALSFAATNVSCLAERLSGHLDAGGS